MAGGGMRREPVSAPPLRIDATWPPEQCCSGPSAISVLDMLFVDNRGITDARVNLALEEYVFRARPADEDVLLFYVNDRAIIIGRNQNTVEEIDGDVVAARGITVVRRVSVGGAV
jgi:lipoate-protein ligase A